MWPRIAPGRSRTDFYTLLGGLWGHFHHILKFFTRTPPPRGPSEAGRRPAPGHFGPGVGQKSVKIAKKSWKNRYFFPLRRSEIWYFGTLLDHFGPFLAHFPPILTPQMAPEQPKTAHNGSKMPFFEPFSRLLVPFSGYFGAFRPQIGSAPLRGDGSTVRDALVCRLLPLRVVLG